MMTRSVSIMWDPISNASLQEIGCSVYLFVVTSNSGLRLIDPGGKLANNDAIVNIGLQLNDACWNTYAGDAYVFRHLIRSTPHSLSSYQDRYWPRGIRISFARWPGGRQRSLRGSASLLHETRLLHHRCRLRPASRGARKQLLRLARDR